MRNDDLCKIVKGELDGEAEKMFSEEFGEDLELARAAFDHSCKYVYERAIVAYQREQHAKFMIIWGVGDVEIRARDNGYILQDGQAQKVLDMLRARYDCNIGITWDVIDDCLGYIVPCHLGDG